MPLVGNTYSAVAAVALEVPAIATAAREGRVEAPAVRASRSALLTGPVAVAKSKWRVIFVFVLYF